jgi:hypothetical protein
VKLPRLHTLDWLVIIGALALLVGAGVWVVFAIGVAGQIVAALWWWFRRTLLGAVVAQKLGLRPLSESGDPRYRPPRD